MSAITPPTPTGTDHSLEQCIRRDKRSHPYCTHRCTTCDLESPHQTLFTIVSCGETPDETDTILAATHDADYAYYEDYTTCDCGVELADAPYVTILMKKTDSGRIHDWELHAMTCPECQPERDAPGIVRQWATVAATLRLEQGKNPTEKEPVPVEPRVERTTTPTR